MIGLVVILAGVAILGLVGLGAAQAGASTTTPSTSTTTSPAGGATTGTGAVAPKAGVLLTSGQQTFAAQLQAQTGLDPGVIAAWLLAEENGGAAQGRQAARNNDWLNIGYTDTATLGAGNSVWSDPTTAANASAAWLKGTWADPGFGKASSGIQHILDTVGQPAATQISAIQRSGWATSGYPDLPSLLASVGG